MPLLSGIYYRNGKPIERQRISIVAHFLLFSQQKTTNRNNLPVNLSANKQNTKLKDSDRVKRVDLPLLFDQHKNTMPYEV